MILVAFILYTLSANTVTYFPLLSTKCSNLNVNDVFGEFLATR